MRYSTLIYFERRKLYCTCKPRLRANLVREESQWTAGMVRLNSLLFGWEKKISYSSKVEVKTMGHIKGESGHAGGA